MKIKSMLNLLFGIITIVGIISFDIGFGNNLNLNDNTTLPMLTSMNSASAENPPDGYLHCVSGHFNQSGMWVIWCGNCEGNKIWPESQGYCRKW